MLLRRARLPSLRFFSRPISIATMATAAVAPSSTPFSSSPAPFESTSYAHVTFPLPEKRYVGMLHCQRDPLASTLVTRVVRCDKVKVASLPAAVASKAAGKGKKGATAAAPPPSSSSEASPAPAEEWEVELEDTVLFPEGGGQPSDTGRIIPLVEGQGSSAAAGEPAQVRQVIRRNLDAVHFVSKPLEVGSQVRLEVDMERRRDLMDQHTGQHLLSAVLEHEYKIDTLSWSLQKFPELCYIELPRAPSAEELASVQQRCNELIGEARPIRVKFELATDETGVQLGEHVPSDYKAGDKEDERPPVQRTVIIDELDENPCCGTHYPSLAYLRTLYISPNTTSIRGSNSRIYFCVGSSRVLAYLASIQAPARQAALEAGCGLNDLPGKVEGLVSATAESKRREKRLHAELAQYVAKDLWLRAATLSGNDASSHDGTGGPIRAALLREEDATNSLDFLGTVSLELKTLADSAAAAARQQGDSQGQQQQQKKHVFILACGATAGTPHAVAAGGAVLITGTDEVAVANAGKRVVETFGKERVKGGGKGRWQGKVTGKWEKGDDLLLDRILEEVVGQAQK
ncbi:hypothetical protein BMF94_5301 [Rhodotorula taiwanensis]|uniref:Threonyl/alanyl tRNA synthetase SAD domain-containing protein n=1 Tax=Rhodotorula taiwanensis TaxID=741276 RepID=A0A2S5B4J6_9BASI|nr:hypothetical protein BMF94_5301 [Rhodotorula taiwanensis]